MDLDKRVELHIPQKYLFLMYHALSKFNNENNVEWCSDFHVVQTLLGCAIHDFDGSEDVVKEGFKRRW